MIHDSNNSGDAPPPDADSQETTQRGMPGNPGGDGSSVEAGAGRTRTRRWMVIAVLCLIAAVTMTLVHRPLRREWHIRRTTASRDLIELENAKTHAQQAVELSPEDDWTSLLLLAQIQRLQDDLDGSTQTLETARSRGAPEELLKSHRWLNVARGGNVSAAGWQLPQLLSSDRMDARDVSEAFVIGFLGIGRFSEAERLLHAWELDFPDDYRLTTHRAVIAQMQSDWKEAVRLYTAARTQGDQRLSTARRLGECLLEAGDPQRAGDVFQSCVDRDPDWSDAWLGLARSLLAAGDDQRARAALEQCLARDPRSFDASLALAKLDRESGQSAEAIARCESLLEAWPQDGKALYEYGQALEAVGRHAEATAALEKWKQADGVMQEVEVMIADLQRQPTDLTLRTEIGIRLMQHYSRSMGLQYLLAAVHADWSNRQAHAELARYYEWQGDQTAEAVHRTAAGE